MIFCYIYSNKNILLDMKLNERLNVLIQATTLSQKSGVLTLDEAVKAKTAIDIISSGVLNQDFTSAINVLIELSISSQNKGAFTLKDAYMLYLAIEGIDNEFQNEVNRLNGVGVVIPQEEPKPQEVKQNNNVESVILIPPKKLKKNS